MALFKHNKSTPTSLAEKIGLFIYRLRHPSLERPLFISSTESLNNKSTYDETKAAGFIGFFKNLINKSVNKFFNALESIYPFNAEHPPKAPTEKHSQHNINITNMLNALFKPILELTESIYVLLFQSHEKKQHKLLPRIINIIRKKGLILIVVMTGYLMAQGIITLSPRHVVVFTMIPLAIAFIAMKPVFGVSVYLFLSVTVLQFTMWNFPSSFLGLPMFLSTPILLATMLSWLIEVVNKKERFRGIYDSNNSLMILFWGFLTISALFAIPEYLSIGAELGDYLPFANACLIFFVIIYIIGKDKKKFFYMVTAVAGIYAYFTYKILRKAAYFGFGTDYSVTGGAGGQLADNNELAACIAMAVPIFYALFLCSKTKPRKAFFLMAFIMAIAAVIYTRSRGGLLGLGVISIPLFFKLVLSGNKNKILPIALTSVLVLAGYGVFHEKINSRVASIENWQEDQSAKNRIISVIAAWEMMKDSPLFGQGSFSSGKVIPFFPDFGVLIRTGFTEDDSLLLEKPGKNFVVHNAYGALGGQYGIPALIVFIWLIFRSIKKLRDLRKQVPLNEDTDWIHYLSHALELSILSYATTAMFLNNPQQILIYVVYALTSSLCYIVLKPAEKHSAAISILGLILFGYWLYTTVGMGILRAGG